MKKFAALLVALSSFSVLAVPCERELYDSAVDALLTHYPSRTMVVENGIVPIDYDEKSFIVYLFTVDTEEKHFSSWKVELKSETTCSVAGVTEFME